MARKRKAKAPWDRAAPKKARHTKLSSGQKSAAKRRAKKAGRPYPNLVDNMSQARKKKVPRKKKAPRKK
jgi:hypothetical protein